MESQVANSSIHKILIFQAQIYMQKRPQIRGLFPKLLLMLYTTLDKVESNLMCS